MVSKRKTFRFEIDLKCLDDDKPTIVNYNDLVKKALSERSSCGANLLSPARRESPARGNISFLRRPRKMRRWEMPDFGSLGTGYQEDSFIDNSETCDESVSSSHLHLGYCMHSKSDSVCELDSDIECENTPEQRSDAHEPEFDRDQTSVLQSTPEFLKLLDCTPEISHVQKKNSCKEPQRVLKTPARKGIAKAGPGNLKRPQLNSTAEPEVIDLGDSPKSDSSAHSPKHPRSSTVPIPYLMERENSSPSVSVEEPSCSGLGFGEETPERSSNEEPMAVEKCGTIAIASLSVASQTNNGDSTIPDSSSNAQSTVVDGNLIKKSSPQLPNNVIQLLDTVMSTGPPDKKKNIPENYEILLKLGDECRKIPASSRMFVYEKVAQYWNCTVKSVSKRVGRLRSQLDERPVKDSLLRLRSQLSAESNVGLDRSQGLTSVTTELLRAAVRAKSHWLERHPPRKGDAAQALLRFTHEELLPLWAASGPGAGHGSAHALAAAHAAARLEASRMLPHHDALAASAPEPVARPHAGRPPATRAPAVRKTGTRESGTRESGTRESGTRESGTRESGTRESGTRESGTRESGTRESGTRESGTRESGTRESGTRESGTRESGTRESGTRESGTRESGTREAGTREAGTREAGTREAGTREAGTREAGTREAGTRESSAPESATRGSPAHMSTAPVPKRAPKHLERAVGKHSPRVAPALLHDLDDSLWRDPGVVAAAEGAKVGVNLPQQAALGTVKGTRRKSKRKAEPPPLRYDFHSAVFGSHPSAIAPRAAAHDTHTNPFAAFAARFAANAAPLPAHRSTPSLPSLDFHRSPPLTLHGVHLPPLPSLPVHLRASPVITSLMSSVVPTSTPSVAASSRTRSSLPALPGPSRPSQRGSKVKGRATGDSPPRPLPLPPPPDKCNTK